MDLSKPEDLRALAEEASSCMETATVSGDAIMANSYAELASQAASCASKIEAATEQKRIHSLINKDRKPRPGPAPVPQTQTTVKAK